MPKMRTINEAHAELIREDPECSLSLNALRKLVTTGQLPGVIRIGAKYLLDVDGLKNWLSSGVIQPVDPQHKLGILRRIPE